MLENFMILYVSSPKGVVFLFVIITLLVLTN